MVENRFAARAEPLRSDGRGRGCSGSDRAGMRLDGPGETPRPPRGRGCLPSRGGAARGPAVVERRGQELDLTHGADAAERGGGVLREPVVEVQARRLIGSGRNRRLGLRDAGRRVAVELEVSVAPAKQRGERRRGGGSPLSPPASVQAQATGRSAAVSAAPVAMAAAVMLMGIRRSPVVRRARAAPVYTGAKVATNWASDAGRETKRRPRIASRAANSSESASAA